MLSSLSLSLHAVLAIGFPVIALALTAFVALLGAGQTVVIAVASGGLIAAIPLSFFLVRRHICLPVATLAAAAQSIVANHEVNLSPLEQRHGSVGDLAAGLAILQRAAQQAERLKAEQESAKAKGEADRARALAVVAETFEAEVKGVVDTIAAMARDMHETADAMSEAAQETTATSGQVSSAAGQASANVQTVASATEELAVSSQEIARRMTEAQTASNAAVQEAQAATEIVDSLVVATDRIGEILKMITDIAAQTNLLALNATIEAARAGDAGKGFAVVANEVKSLAGQTARATDQVAEQMEGMQKASGHAVEAIKRIAGRITDISDLSRAVAEAVDQQRQATDDIARNVNQAAAGTQEVTIGIDRVDQVAQETGQAARQVLLTAQSMSERSEHLLSQIDGFLDHLQTRA